MPYELRRSVEERPDEEVSASSRLPKRGRVWRGGDRSPDRGYLEIGELMLVW